MSHGQKPKGKIKLEWSSNFAYAIGLIASDGCLSKNGRHISFVSKDREQIDNFLRALCIKDIKIGINYSGYKNKWAYRVQFGDVLFHRFLMKIGMMPNKSKVLGELLIPEEYFLDFLRGVFDGDGCTHSYWDKRWKSSFMLYTYFASASITYIRWLKERISDTLGLVGDVNTSEAAGCYQLKYAKKESLFLLEKMYYSDKVLHLARKKLKIDKAVCIIEGQSRKVLTK